MHFFLLFVLPVALAHPQDLIISSTSSTQSPQASFLGLSASADATLQRTIDVGFSCANRRLGYYADVSNDCKVFHICNPVSFADGQQAVMQYSFFCPANSSFDQRAMTCVRDPSIPCTQSESFYQVNEKSGVTAELPEELPRHHQHASLSQPIGAPTPTGAFQQAPRSRQPQAQQLFPQQSTSDVQPTTFTPSFPQQQQQQAVSSSHQQSLDPPGFVARKTISQVVRLG